MTTERCSTEIVKAIRRDMDGFNRYWPVGRDTAGTSSPTSSNSAISLNSDGYVRLLEIVVNSSLEMIAAGWPYACERILLYALSPERIRRGCQKIFTSSPAPIFAFLITLM